MAATMDDGLSLAEMMSMDDGEENDDDDDDSDESYEQVSAGGGGAAGKSTDSTTPRFGVPYDFQDDEEDEIDGMVVSDEVLFSHERYFSARLLELLKGSLAGGSAASSTGLLSGVYPMLLHQTFSPHPERPARMVAIYHEIIEQGLDARCKLVPVRAAAQADLALVHTPEQVKMSTCTYIDDESASAALGLDSDTYFAAGASGHAALLAAGSLVELTTRVVTDELSNALAVVRPPGHHCECSQAMGFCLINNVCVAVAVARARFGVGRVLVLDWDVHHGNGIQHIFEEDPNVLYVSTHRFGGGFYPGTGHPSEVGVGAGEGTSVNVAFTSEGCGDREYMHAFHRLIMPIAREYAPELVLVSAGFDAAEGDPLGGMALSPAGYAQMTAQMMSLAGGKVVIALEGGYNLRAISTSAAACLRVLLGEAPPLIEGGAARPDAQRDIEFCVGAMRPYWKCLQPPCVPSAAGGEAARAERAERRVRALAAKLKKAKRKALRAPWWHKYL